MSSNPALRIDFDPLDDDLYCQAPYSHDNVLSKSTSAAYETDEATIRRCEDVARRYLSGRAPRLITSALRGPFDQASGFVNPWAPALDKTQPTTQQLAHSSLRRKQSPTLCEPATSPRLDPTQTTESSYLPSPESLNCGSHPFLEHDEVARVEKWRDLVQSNAPIKEEFWASKNRSSTKRPRDDSSWLKRRPDKKPRTLEPEPKLSSPVSIPDKNLRQQEASSPLSSLTSSSGLPTPRQASTQARVEANVHPDESTVTRASLRGLPPSSQRLSQRASQTSRLSPKPETLRNENRRTRSPNTAVRKASPKRAGPSRLSSRAAKPRDSSTSSNDSSTDSSSQSSSEEVSETKLDLLEPTDGPTVFVESDEVMEGQDDTQLSQPGEDRVLQAIDFNATPRSVGGDATGAADGEDARPCTVIAPNTPFQKPVDPNLEIQGPLAKEEESKCALLDSSVAASPSSGLRNAGHSQDRHSLDRTASKHSHEEAEPTPAPAPAAEDRSRTSVTSASSTVDSTSTNPVEDRRSPTIEEAQPSHERQPSKPSVSDTANCSLPPKTDNAAPKNESQPQQTEACSTFQINRHTEDAAPDCKSTPPGPADQRVATQEQSPWAKDSSKDLADEASEGSSQSHGTQEDEQTRSFIIPPEAQSPWIQRPASQPQVAKDALSSPFSSPQLPPHSQEEPRVKEEPDRSNLLSDVSNTDFSIRSFSSFMSPLPKPRPTPRASDSHLPRTPSLLAAATENPWQAFSRPKKRVSWAPLPHEVDSSLSSPAPAPLGSPPPAAPIPDDVEEGSDIFKRHFATVKRRTDPVRQRLLPSASQQSQRSPETAAMARAFVVAGSPVKSSPARIVGSWAEEDTGTGTRAGGEENGEAKGEVEGGGPVDEVDDVLANLGDFLTAWTVDTDLERARAEDHAPSTPRRGIVDVEIGGW